MKNVAKSITKKAIVALLTLVLVLGTLPFTAPLTVQADPVPFNTFVVGTATDLAALQGQLNALAAGSSATVTFTGIFTTTAQNAIQINNGLNITVTGGGIWNQHTSGQRHFSVGGNATLTLQNISLSRESGFGLPPNPIINSGGILVGTGHLILNTGTIISNNRWAAAMGGGISVLNGGILTMYGGSIVDNVTPSSGGGVDVRAGGQFIMHDGIIGGNNVVGANGGGGVFVGGTFTMHGGNISSNTVNSNTGGGVALQGSAATRAVFHMYGGSISGNNALTSSVGGGGIRMVSHATFNMTGGSIQNNRTDGRGGGISIGSPAGNMASPNIVTISGGVIRNNTAYGAGGGGGIAVVGAGNSVAINQGTRIYGNEAINGAGILVNNSATLTASNSSITNNHAEYFGGGIWTDNYGSLNISNSVTFRDNTAGAGAFDHWVNHSGDTPCPHCPNLPANASGATGGSIANINWARVSLWGSHALNNYDINYYGMPWVPPTYLTPEIDIEKTFRLPTGSLLPTPPSRTTIDFRFEMWLVEVNGFNPPQFRLPGQPAGEYQHRIFPGRGNSPTISFTPATAPSPGNGYVAVTGTYALCFAEIVWPFPGVFVFEVRELSNTSGLLNAGLGTMVYDPARFRIYVHTRWLDDDQQHVGVWYYYAHVPFVNCAACITTPNGNNGNGNGTTPEPCTCTGCATGNFCAACRRRVKGNEVPFNNRFAPNGSLVVEKAVTGTSQLNTEFEFGMVLTLPPLMAGHHPTSVTAYIYGYTRQNGQPVEDQPKVRVGNAITVPVVVTEGVATATLPTFHLRHGDEIRFASLPIGTTYVVTEANQDRYTQTARVTIGGTTGTVIEQIGTAALTIPGSVAQRMYNEAIDSASNRVVVTNARVDIPPMAAMFNDAPFGLMLAIGAGALGLVGTVAIAYKKKKR